MSTTERVTSLSCVHLDVAENGNMLIMVLSYTQQTGDTSLVKTYVSNSQQWHTRPLCGTF